MDYYEGSPFVEFLFFPCRRLERYGWMDICARWWGKGGIWREMDGQGYYLRYPGLLLRNLLLFLSSLLWLLSRIQTCETESLYPLTLFEYLQAFAELHGSRARKGTIATLPMCWKPLHILTYMLITTLATSPGYSDGAPFRPRHSELAFVSWDHTPVADPTVRSLLRTSFLGGCVRIQEVTAFFFFSVVSELIMYLLDP